MFLHAPTVHHPLAQAGGLGWHRNQIQHTNGGRYRLIASAFTIFETLKPVCQKFPVDNPTSHVT